MNNFETSYLTKRPMSSAEWDLFQLSNPIPQDLNVPRIPVQVRLAHPLAKMPEYAHPTDSCFDIFSIENHELEVGALRKIKVGIILQAPIEYEFQFEDKSGMAAQGITTRGGTIDAGYTGEISVILVNEGWETYVVNIGDKIAQVRLQLRHVASFKQVDTIQSRDRGTASYGSTGLTARTQ